MHKVFKRKWSVKVAPDYHAKMRNTGDIVSDRCKLPHLLLFGGTVRPVQYQEIYDKIDYVSPTQLYNSMSDGQLSTYKFDPNSLLIVDVRPVEEFRSFHVSTAYHINVIECGDASTLDAYAKIILYDAQGDAEGSDHNILDTVMRSLKEKNSNTFGLLGGFEAFRSKHPYLCSSDEVTSETMRQNLIGDYPSLVLEGQLYLGRADQAASSRVINDLMITHVLNVTEVLPVEADNKLTRLNISVTDDSEADLLTEMPKGIIFMNKVMKENGRLLVHCMLGVSRSSTVVIAYLMHTRRWTLADAYDFLRKIRPIVQPNSNFRRQLHLYEEMLFARRISDESDCLWCDSD